jgi:hypothetical protein
MPDVAPAHADPGSCDSALSCVFPLVAGDIDYGSVLYVSLTLSVPWLGMAIYAIAKYRRRGWWTMLGLLPALYWPYMTAALYYACYVLHDCL